MVIYADASFLVSLYIAEEKTEAARDYMERGRVSLAFTSFHRLELRTALRLRVFRKDVGQNFLRESFRQMETDLREGLLDRVNLNWNDTFREAEEIAQAHLIPAGVRSSDLLHVASAVVLGAIEFCTFDQRQAELAKRAGLKVKTWR